MSLFILNKTSWLAFESQNRVRSQHKSFYATLPELPAVAPQEADIAWFLYSLEWHAATNRFHLTRDRVVYTAFEPAMLKITTAPVGPIEDFIAHVQSRLNNSLNSPDAPPSKTC